LFFSCVTAARLITFTDAVISLRERGGANRVWLLIYIRVSTKLWPILNRIYLKEGCHGLLLKSEQNIFVQSNTTQIYFFSLIALTCILHVSAVYKIIEYMKRPFRFLVYFPVYISVLTRLNIA